MGLFSNVINIFGRKSTGNTNYIAGQAGAVLLDTTKPQQIYNSVPQLKAVVDMKAQMFSNMLLKIVDNEGVEVVDLELSKLLEYPNVLQSQNSFLKQWKIQEQVFGNQFTYANKPSALSKYPVSLSNISPAYIKPYLTGKIYNQVSIDGIIKHYNYSEYGNNEAIFETKDIMFSKIGALDNNIIGVSPICALALPLSNISSAYKFRNVIMNNKGALGILSSGAKDGMGSLPLKPEEKTRIENSHQDRYGIADGKMKLLITDNPVTWQAMSYPTRDLMLFEEIDTNMLAICDAYGLNANIFSSKNATFENAKQAIIQAYQDTIIPEADSFCQSLTQFLKLQNGMRIVADFSHISILKDDESKAINNFATLTNSVTTLVNSGLITAQNGADILNENSTNEIQSIVDSGVSGKINKLSPLVANKVLTALTVNETRAIAGLANIDGGDVLPTATTNSFVN